MQWLCVPCYAMPVFPLFFFSKSLKPFLCTHHRMRSNVDRCIHVRPFLLCLQPCGFNVTIKMRMKMKMKTNNYYSLWLYIYLLWHNVCACVFHSFFSSLKQMLCFRNFFLCFLIFFFFSGQKQNGISSLYYSAVQSSMQSPFFGTQFVNVILKCFTKIAKWLSCYEEISRFLALVLCLIFYIIHFGTPNII